MQLINHQYHSLEKLELFLTTLLSIPHQSLFVQFFSGTTDKSILQPVLDYLSAHLPNINLIGATTAGEILDGSISDSGIVIAFSLFEATDISTYYYPKANFEDGVCAALEVVTQRTKACIMFNEGYKSDSELFLDGFTSICNDIMIAGGNASDGLSFIKTYVIEGSAIHDEGMVIAVLDSDVLIVNNASSFSWTPVGREMIITKVANSTIYEIDDQPVKDIYTNYLGSKIISNLPLSAVEFPLVKLEDDIAVARTLIEIDGEGGFIYAGHFNQGDIVRFAIGNTEEVLTRASEIQALICSNPLEATYIYSCVARKLYLQEQVNYELGLINNIAPSVGFFTYGEFYHSSHKNKLLHITTTTLSLSEKNTSFKFIELPEVHSHKHSMLESLTHLLNVVQAESDYNRKLLSEGLIDEVTGIKNRLALLNDMKAIKDSVSLALININHFSNVNNYYGYQFGDKLLRVFAKKLQASAGHNHVYRVSGDEFAVLGSKIQTSQEYRKSIMMLFAHLNGCSFLIDTHDIFVNISAGSATSDNLMVYNLAHIALKEAKEHQGKVIFYDDHITLKTKIQNNILMLSKIKSALKNDKIIPYFQGIVDIKTRKIVKYESLIRMIDEEGNVLSPYFFLEHAKKSNLYSSLTQTMIIKTFKHFEHLETDFSINLLLEDIKNDETKNLLYNTLQKSPATKHAIFEIVESEGIEEFDEVAAFIDKVKSYGCRIAIDDFGTGYSNFSYLAQLNIDFIKIDGSLIKNITTNPDHLLAVESIIFFAHKKGIKTIAEFVEDEVTFDKLVDLGVSYCQGYLFSIPSPKLSDQV